MGGPIPLWVCWGVHRLHHGTRGVPFCAACQTWLTCGHLSPEPPWVHNGRGEQGPMVGRWCTLPSVFLSLSPNLFLSLHLVVSDPASPSRPPPPPPGHCWFHYPPTPLPPAAPRCYLTRCFRMSAAAARHVGPCECVGAERTQERRLGNNELDCWFPPTPPPRLPPPPSPLCCSVSSNSNSRTWQ